MSQKDKGGGARKYGRNNVACKAYREADKRNRNKLRRLVRHMRGRDSDPCAEAAIVALRKVVTNVHQRQDGTLAVRS